MHYLECFILRSNEKNIVIFPVVNNSTRENIINVNIEYCKLAR